MKLIHSGKVLKDDDSIESCNIKPNDFLVVMITKVRERRNYFVSVQQSLMSCRQWSSVFTDEIVFLSSFNPYLFQAKKTPAPTPAAAADAATAVPATPATTANPPTTPAAPGPSTSSAATAAATATTPGAPAAASDVSSPDEFPAEVVNNLIALGFPESSVRACLRAADGNPDVAVEFLMNGIPPGIGSGVGVTAVGGSTASDNGGEGGPLETLRRHPQFDALRRLVQTNPSMLQAVLTQIGQQQPELLDAINANQALFLEMMNEPVADAPPSESAVAPSQPPIAAPHAGAGADSSNAFAGIPGMEALGNPVQLAQMLQAMPPQEQQAMAQMMGMDVNQLQQLAQMISAMPPEQVQQHMNMAMQAQGLGGMLGGGGGGAGGFGGAQVLRLSEEEMAAVDRLTEMGFDRSEAAQAYLACDKNEALAANLLMDGGFGAFGGMGGEEDYDDDVGGGDDDMYE